MQQSLKFEKYHPAIIGLVIAFAFYKAHAWFEFKMPCSNTYGYFSALITLGGIFVGLSSAAHSLIMSSEERTRTLEESGYMLTFERYTSESTMSAFLLIVLGVAGFFPKVADCSIFIPATIGALSYSFMTIKRARGVSKAVARYKKPIPAG